MTAIITVANQKGGVGKTTTAINLSAALAHRGKRTLLIDLDPQANSTIAFYDTGEIATSMFDVLSDSRTTLTAVIKPTKDPLLFLGPGRLSLAKLEQVLAGQFDAPFKLKDAMTPVLKDYDYVILDTPPSLGILTVNALVASTHLLVPIQAAYFAIEGTDDSRGPDSPQSGPAAQRARRPARAYGVGSRKGRAGTVAGALCPARGLLPHYFGRAAVPCFARGGPAGSALH